uniref:Uncharacterized protein n=1 Tax=Ditylenchus dipsaci TaxID=166011 RepID=A0A915DDH0_9BILA
MDSALGISKVQFCPDPAARLLVASTWDGFVKAFRVASLEEVSNVCNYFHENPVLCCTFAGSSKIVTGMLDGLVKLYDIESGYEGVIGGHLDCMCRVLSPDNLAVTGGWDSVVKMWDCRLEMVHRDVGQLQCSDRVYALDVSGNRAVIATKDRQVMIYDFRNTSLPLQIRPSPLKYQTRAIKIMPSGQAFAVSSIEGRVAISYFDEDPAFQQNNCEFECHRIKTEKEELIYPVNALAIHLLGLLLREVRMEEYQCGILLVRKHYVSSGNSQLLLQAYHSVLMVKSWQ